jgi:hypothetical protein
MPDWNIGIGGQGEIGIVMRYNAEHFGSGGQAFYDYDPDIVSLVMNQQLRDFQNVTP